MREGTVLHTGDEDDRELQALGRVDGHERDLAVLGGLARGLIPKIGRVRQLVRVRHQADALQEVGEHRVGVGCLEVSRHRVQLGQVLHAGGVLGVIAGS